MSKPAKPGINKKQEFFLQEYVKCWNATRAAKLAGYSEKTAHDAGCRILKKVEAQDFISNFMKNRGQTTEVTVENIITEVAVIAFAGAYEKTTDRLKALELLGKKFGIWDGISGDSAGRDRSSTLEKVFEAIRKHS